MSGPRLGRAMFPPIPYLEWIQGRPEAATHDLGSSDLRTHESWASLVPEPLADRADPDDPPPLPESIAAEYGVDPACVLLTAGATHANFLVAATAISGTDADADAGDPGVLVERPGYDPLVHTPGGLGARVDRFERPAGEDYAVQADRLADAVGSDTALVTVTNRHNPTGRLSTREELADAAEAAAGAGAGAGAGVGATLHVDEVYAPFVATARGDRGFGGVTAAGLPGTVVTGSLTKFHGLGELRFGWLVGPPEFVDRAEEIRHHVPAVAGPSAFLATRFFEHRDALVADSRELVRENHRRLSDFVDGRDDLSGTIHDGCSYGFVTHESADGDALADAAWDAGLLVIPGRFFDAPAGVRISAGRDPAATDAALAAFGDVLDGL